MNETIDATPQSAPVAAEARAQLYRQVILAHWEREIEPFVAIACERSLGRYSPSIILDQLLSFRMNLWLAMTPENRITGVAITHLVDYGTGLREAQLSLVGGVGIGMRTLRRGLLQIASWAKSWGAHVLYFEGREGLMRTGPWRKLAVSAEIRL